MILFDKNKFYIQNHILELFTTGKFILYKFESLFSFKCLSNTTEHHMHECLKYEKSFTHCFVPLLLVFALSIWDRTRLLVCDNIICIIFQTLGMCSFVCYLESIELCLMCFICDVISEYLLTVQMSIYVWN